MFPTILQIGSFTIHTYGLMMAIGFLAALWVSSRLTTQQNENPGHMVDLAFYALISGFIGSRILYVITRWDDFSGDLMGIFRVWEGGLVFFGGILGALPVGYWFVKKKKMPVWKTLDAAIPGLVIAHMFGRLGCLSAGCCYGKPTGSDWGIILNTDVVSASLRGVPLHPTQFYEASALFVIFLGLLWIFKKRRFSGQVALTYFMVYPLVRSVIEVFRGDLIRGFVIEDILSTSQFISIWFFIIALILFVRRWKQSQPE